MSKKYFIFSDVHGFYDELLEALNKQGFDKDNPDHIIISCGDLLDRGEQPRQCLQFVNSLHKQGRAILIKGNHETLLQIMLTRGYPLEHDYSNGTVLTVASMFSHTLNIDELWANMKEDEDYNYYKSNLIDFYETDTHIFVHGWIPVKSDYNSKDYEYDEEWRTIDKPDEIYEKWHKYEKWDRFPEGARWINGIKAWNNGLNKTGKTIVIGHYHCSYGWSQIDNDREEFPSKVEENWEKSFEPYIKEGLMAIDGCTAYSGIVNVIVIEGE